MSALKTISDRLNKLVANLGSGVSTTDEREIKDIAADLDKLAGKEAKAAAKGGAGGATSTSKPAAKATKAAVAPKTRRGKTK